MGGRARRSRAPHAPAGRRALADLRTPTGLMARLASTSAGIGRVEGEQIELLNVDYGDIGEALARGVDAADLARAPMRERVAASAVRLLAPVPRPPKIWAAGWAYRAHREE